MHQTIYQHKSYQSLHCYPSQKMPVVPLVAPNSMRGSSCLPVNFQALISRLPTAARSKPLSAVTIKSGSMMSFL